MFAVTPLQKKWIVVRQLGDALVATSWAFCRFVLKLLAGLTAADLFGIRLTAVAGTPFAADGFLTFPALSAALGD